MANKFHVKRKDMTPEERKANDLHLRRSRLFSDLNRKDRELEALREEVENLDPEIRRLKEELKAIETRQAEIKLVRRRLVFDSLPVREKRALESLGLSPYQQDADKVFYRVTGEFE